MAEPTEKLGKLCSRCQRLLPLTEEHFNRNKSTLSGFGYWCRNCSNEARRIHWRQEPNKLRIRAKIDQRRYRERKKSASKAYRKQYPERMKARQEVRKAIKNDQLVTPASCENCGVSITQYPLLAHHDDYYRPLDVLFLCSSCHMVLHLNKQKERVCNG